MTSTTFAVGGDIEVRRLGFGAMRITGPGTWGPPRDRAAARALLIGVSNVTLEELAVARTITDIATVQTRLDLAKDTWHAMLRECEPLEIGFIPYRPLRAWDDAAHQQVLTAAASRHGATTSQIALAWLLAVSPVTLPIPGTATLAHLEDNLAAAALQLDRDEIHLISVAVGVAAPSP